MLANQFFNQIENIHDTDVLSEQYNNSVLIPHIIVDNFLPDDIFDKLCKEIDSFPEDKLISKSLQYSGTRKESRDFSESPLMQEIMTKLTACEFVKWMSKITNCNQIIPDIHHLGAGLSTAPSDAFLGLHVDFNWNDTLKLNRKFNLILYANKIWEDDWNGELEFWKKDRTECLYSIKPLPNRLIFWEYEQQFLHGFSKPLKCPQGVERRNLMTVYYTSNSTPTNPPHKSLFTL